MVKKNPFVMNMTNLAGGRIAALIFAVNPSW
jgi:hypothetical protein